MQSITYGFWRRQVEPQLWGPRQSLVVRAVGPGTREPASSTWVVLEGGDAKQNIEKSLRLGAALRSFWMVRGYYSEGRNFLEQALARSEGIEKAVRAKGLWAAATMAEFQRDNDLAEALNKESLALYRELEDRRGIAYALYYLGAISA